MKCRDCINQFSDMQDGLLSKEETRRVEDHLGSCFACTSEWELFQESLASLSLLSGEQAPSGFKESVMRRIAERKEKRTAPWRLMLSPAGAAFCTALLLVGAALGFFAGKQEALSFPSEELRAMVEADGVVFLPGAGGKDYEYALVPIRDEAHRAVMSSRLQRPERAGEEMFIGGSESAEIYLRPQTSLVFGMMPTPRRETSTSQDRVLKAMLEDSY